MSADSRAPLGTVDTEIECQIISLSRIATDVVSIELARRDGAEMPEWQPGSHIDLLLPDGLVRQYSLCGDPEDRTRYRVAVLREEAGSGGSAFVHDRLSMSDGVSIRGPRNNFALEPASEYLFVAGGIGITAILPMVREAHRRGADWSLVYLGRARDRMAFAEEIEGLPPERIRIHVSEESGRASVAEIAADTRTGAKLFACGPAELLAALAEVWNEDDLHFERFEPDAAALAAPKAAFRVQLTTSARTLDVASDESILDVVEAEGIPWPYSCREGTCGSCETRIVAGRADHRDAVLTPAERRAQEYMMICVSRAATPELSLEI